LKNNDWRLIGITSKGPKRTEIGNKCQAGRITLSKFSSEAIEWIENETNTILPVVDSDWFDDYEDPFENFIE